MPSTTEPSTGGPISHLPYDVLREIFTHCLPQYPLRYLQPDSMIAPIRLCHICSSWRTVALTAATLWTHIYFHLTIIVEEDYNSDSYKSGTVKFVAREIQFLRCWRKKQGSIAPFLRFRVSERYSENINEEMAEDTTLDFLLEYITSAQFLDLDRFYWRRIYERIKAGHHVVFPNLHTTQTELTWGDIDTFSGVLTLLPENSLPMFQHLSIDEDASLDDFNIPDHWPIYTLTHIFVDADITLNVWFSFIRAVPNLRWGHFSLTSVSNVDHVTPRKCTLLQLVVLSVGLHPRSSRRESPLSWLFTELYLPALRSLSLLSNGEQSWEDHHAITDLYGILKSTPTITKLRLGYRFLSLSTHDTTIVLAAIEDVEPIWNCASELVNLQLFLPWDESEAEMEATVDLFVRNIFSSDGGWLDLRNPACPIRLLTIANGASHQRIIVSSIQKYAGKASKVVLQMTEDSAEPLAIDTRAGWGSRI